VHQPREPKNNFTRTFDGTAIDEEISGSASSLKPLKFERGQSDRVRLLLPEVVEREMQ
jgi:hypothetical protein